MGKVFCTEVDAIYPLAQESQEVEFEFELARVVADIGPVDVVELQILQIWIGADMETERQICIGGCVDDGVHFAFDIHEDVTWVPAPVHRPRIADVERAFVRKSAWIEVVEC
ncbi:MAG: hypothetical protein RL137_49 [Bacteroidota bacterium]